MEPVIMYGSFAEKYPKVCLPKDAVEGLDSMDPSDAVFVINRMSDQLEERDKHIEAMKDTIADLLHRLDVALAPEDGSPSMHAYSQTPDWFVEAAYQSVYGKPSPYLEENDGN